MSIYFYGCITMDGYLADKNHSLNWLHETGSTEETDYEHFYKKMDITIMGKRTFDEIQNLENIESFYPTTENYVFTHTKGFNANGFNPIDGSIIEFVKQIPKDKNIWIIGGNTILSPLLEENMVDEMIIQIAPVLLGEGIPLFAQKAAYQRFSLKEVKKYGQFAELQYKFIH